jgi:hypothetical protein
MKLGYVFTALLFTTSVYAQTPLGSNSPSEQSSEPVKKSSSGICHSPGSGYYKQTQKFTPYQTIDECLKSGGRLPKR